MHGIGYFTVKNNKIYEKGKKIPIENIALIVDMQRGTVLKLGDINNSNIKEYFDSLVNQYKKVEMTSMVESLQLINFDKYKKILNTDELCTLINYLRSTMAEEFKETLELDISPLRKKLKVLMDAGF